MRKCIIMALAFAAIACDDALTAPEAVAPVSLTFVSATNSTAKLLFANNTSMPVSYWGYSPTGPLMVIQSLAATGWEIEWWDWCATGADIQTLAPNESVVIEISVVRRDVPLRVSFGYRQSADAEYQDVISEFVVSGTRHHVDGRRRN